MGYYGQLGKRAASEALKDAKLDSLVPAIASILAQGLASALLYMFAGSFSGATTVTRILAAAIPFLAFPVAFLIRAGMAPGAMAKEASLSCDSALADKQLTITALENELQALHDPPRPDRFADGIYQHGRLVGIVSGSSMQDGRFVLHQIEDTEGLNHRQAFFFQDRLFVIGSISRSIGSLSSAVLGPDGPKTHTTKAVLQGVRCHEIGDFQTVKRP